MGGSLYGAERMPKDKFLLFLAEFMPKLSLALGDAGIYNWINSGFTPVPYYSEKEDFGDLDIIVKANTDVVRAAVIKHFGLIPEDSKEDHSHQYSTNSNVFSFLHNKFQVDLICTVADYESSIAYYSFNDVGNILGRFYHKLGLKFGHQGLLYPLRDSRGAVKKEIVVCKDTKKILEFLGLDVNKWMNGFTTLEDIFEWVATGRFFDSRIFKGELSPINEKRDRKRKTFSKFLDWVEETNPGDHWCFLTRDDRDRYIPMIDEYFGCDITGQLSEFEIQMEREKVMKSKFSGELVMELTGLKGKSLGDFMTALKEHINIIGTFDSWVYNTEPEKIKEFISAFFGMQVITKQR